MNVFSYLDLFIYSLGNINIQIFYTIWYLIFRIIKREIFILLFQNFYQSQDDLC